MKTLFSWFLDVLIFVASLAVVVCMEVYFIFFPPKDSERMKY